MMQPSMTRKFSKPMHAAFTVSDGHGVRAHAAGAGGVVFGVGVVAQPAGDALITRAIKIGIKRGGAEFVPWFLRGHLTRALDAIHHFFHVTLVIKIVEVNGGMGFRVRRFETNAATAIGAHLADKILEAIAQHHLAILKIRKEAQKLVLHVDEGCARAAVEKSPHFKEVGSAKAALEQQPLQTNPRAAEKAKLVLDGDWLVATVAQRRHDMVLQVFTDTGQIMRHRDAMFAQMIGRADAGEHEQLRRGDGAGARGSLRGALR